MEAIILSDSFYITFDWLPRDYGNELDRSTFAAMEIRINGLVATEVEDLWAKTVRSTLRASAHDLALWFASNWWRLRWEPEGNSPSWKMSHRMGAAGAGYAWPDLSFISDGKVVLAHCRQTSAATADPVRFLSDFDAFIPASMFERGVDEFVGAVIERVDSEARAHPYLREMWEEILEERGDPESTAERKLEAMLGFDPDDSPDGLIDRLRAQAGVVGAGVIEEVAAAASSAALGWLEFLSGEAQSKAVVATIPDYPSLCKELQQNVDPTQLPWQQAVRAAGAVRRKWNLERGPISSLTLSELFGLPKKILMDPTPEPSGPISAGYRDIGGGDHIRVFFNKKHPTAVRFALSRLAADHLYAESQDRLLPATDTKTARQKFQRAFAQEFLCPFEDLMEYLGGKTPTDDLIEEASLHFDVSSLLTKSALVNRGKLDRNVLDM